MPTANSRRNITFQLPQAAYTALQDDATTRGLDSIHLRSREILIDYLHNQSAAEIDARLEAMERELAQLPELLRRLAYSVITHAGGKTSKDANDWIRQHMQL